MKTITVDSDQTIYDIAVQYYGTCEAVGEIIALNPEPLNEHEERNIFEDEYFLDLPLKKGSPLLIDPDSPLVDKKALRDIDATVATDDKVRNGLPMYGNYVFDQNLCLTFVDDGQNDS